MSAGCDRSISAVAPDYSIHRPGHGGTECAGALDLRREWLAFTWDERGIGRAYADRCDLWRWWRRWLRSRATAAAAWEQGRARENTKQDDLSSCFHGNQTLSQIARLDTGPG